MLSVDLGKALLQERVTTSKLGRSKMDLIMGEYSHWSPHSNNVFKGHTDAAWGCTITSNNLYAFSGSCDNLIRIWEVITQKEIGQLSGHTDAINSLALVEDDKVLISASWDKTIKLWDWQNRTEITTLGTHNSAIYAMQLSTNKEYLITGDAGGIAKIWKMSSRSYEGEISCNGNTIFGVWITDDLKDIVIGDFGCNIRFFNFDDKCCIDTFESNAGPIQCLAVTHNKKYLIFGTRNNIIKVWNYNDKSVHCTFTSHRHWVRNVIVTSDDKFFISASPDKTMRIFNISDQIEEYKIEGNEGFVNAICLSQDNQYLLACASDGLMRSWKLGFPARNKILKGHTGTIVSIIISQDNQWIISGSEDKTIKIWNMQTGINEYTLTDHTGSVNDLYLTYNMNKLISVSDDKQVLLWDFNTKTVIKNLEGHKDVVYCLALSFDENLMATGDKNMKIYLWDMRTETLDRIISGHTDTIFALAFTNDAKTLVSGSADCTVGVTNIETSEFSRIKAKCGLINTIALSPDNKFLVIGDRDNIVYLWDWNEKRLIAKFTEHTDFIRFVVFLDNTTFLSVSNDSKVNMWNAVEEKHELELKGHSGSVRCGNFTKDRKAITGGYDFNIILWDLDNVQSLELANIDSLLSSYLYLANIKTGGMPSEKNCNLMFSPIRMNLAHIYAYRGHSELLRRSLEAGTEIRRDTDLHSPLHYAIDRNCQDCTDVIFSFLSDLHDTDIQKFVRYSYALRDDFEKIVQSRSKYVENFLAAAFYKVKDIASFGVPKGELPILFYSPTKRFEINNFVMPSGLVGPDDVEVPIEFRTLPFAIHHLQGSTGSIEMLNSIKNCGNSRILRTDFIKTYIRDKWNNLWYYILFLTFLLWGNLILLTLLIAFKEKNYDKESYFQALSMCLTVINILLGTYECIQAYSSGIRYINDIWNIIDIFRLIITFAWLVVVNFIPEFPYYIILTWVMAALNFLRGLSGFRAFDTTRYYTRLIIKSCLDSISFLLIFFYSTFSFGVLFHIASEASNSMFSIWKTPYELSMGDFTNTESFSLEYVCFMIATIINVIIILNLLISILADSFEAFQAEAEYIDCMEMAEFVSELETLMFWKRDLNSPSYFQMCRLVVGSGQGSWEGRFNAMSGMVDNMKSDLMEYLDKINQKQDLILKKLEANK
ncbi:hypothetical protein SteCoe_8038 [Stentor coeruleus]|uniref:Ion transport domain-containing protein n=1 Tax=Stentor coeruleus TaxID=5963 RepID=A0A1R2CL72_9CILI|nr:hypothetical protein SteCoe_8038 [Stentor coeruleus]